MLRAFLKEELTFRELKTVLPYMGRCLVSLIIREMQVRTTMRASLVVQGLRICLPVQGTLVWSLLEEDSRCHEAAKPVHHSYWTYTLEPKSHNYWTCTPPTPEAGAPRAHAVPQEKPQQWEAQAVQRETNSLLSVAGESLYAATEAQCSRKRRNSRVVPPHSAQDDRH